MHIINFKSFLNLIFKFKWFGEKKIKHIEVWLDNELLISFNSLMENKMERLVNAFETDYPVNCTSIYLRDNILVFGFTTANGVMGKDITIDDIFSMMKEADTHVRFFIMPDDVELDIYDKSGEHKEENFLSAVVDYLELELWTVNVYYNEKGE